MSIKINGISKIPSMNSNLILRNSIKKNTDLKLGEFTPRFVNIYMKYKKTQKKNLFPNIRTLLYNYRSEKLNKLSDQETMREEIENELREYRQIHDILKTKAPLTDPEKFYDTFSKENKSKRKENKVTLLDSIYRHEKNQKLLNLKKSIEIKRNNKNIISPYKIFRIDRNSIREKIKNKYNNKTLILFNEKKLNDLLDKKSNEKAKSIERKKIKIKLKDIWEQYHKSINSVCDSIKDDSIKLNFNGKKIMEKFNTTLNKYKILYRYNNPENKKLEL